MAGGLVCLLIAVVAPYWVFCFTAISTFGYSIRGKYKNSVLVVGYRVVADDMNRMETEGIRKV